MTLKDARRRTLALWRAADEGELPRDRPIAFVPAVVSTTVQAASPPPEPAPPPSAPLITYAQMIERYVELHAKPNARSWRAIEAGLRHAAVQHFMPLHAEEITRRQIIEELVLPSTPSAAITVRKYVTMRTLGTGCD